VGKLLPVSVPFAVEMIPVNFADNTITKEMVVTCSPPPSQHNVNRTDS
jgi:hypothetical protein